MSDVLAISLQALQGDALRLDRISANLANATTPGYKREVALQRTAALAATSTFAGLVEMQAAFGSSATSGSPSGTGIEADVMRDMRVGTLKSTSQPLDLALTGHGFFEIATPAGPAYTRQGQFQLDARGRLVTMQGDAVMGIGGEIQLTSGSPTIDTTGAVFENGRQIAKLKVVDFDDARTMHPVSGGAYAAGKNLTSVDDRNSTVRQGYLENTNVDSMREMVDLIKTMRHFESMQRVVQSYDDLLGTAIRKLGDV